MSIYRNAADKWEYLNRATGLPSDQIQAVAIDASGTAFLGTQADGVFVMSAAHPSLAGRHVRADLRSAISAGTGDGLPSDLVNDIIALSNGEIAVATDAGLAISADSGQTWKHWRGRDASLKGVSPLAAGYAQSFISEDYVASLAEGPGQVLWLGYRRSGFSALSLKDGKTISLDAGMELLANLQFGERSEGGLFVTSLLPLTERSAWIGTYGNIPPSAPETIAPVEEIGTLPTANFPSGAKPDRRFAMPPTVERPSAAKDVVKADAEQRPFVMYLDDDWRTQGDWLGRYGRYWACLAATCSPADFIWGTRADTVDYWVRLDAQYRSDAVRHWVHSMHTDIRRSLELPYPYLDSRVSQGYTTWRQPRRQSEWDDHGEAYPLNEAGPNLTCTITVPAGVYVLSLYNVNKDGHAALNRFRDYLVRVSVNGPDDASATDHRLAESDAFPVEKNPMEARARFRDFWGGVYKRFLVKGPCELKVRIEKNYSYNTILAGVFLDELTAVPSDYGGDAFLLADSLTTYGQFRSFAENVSLLPLELRSAWGEPSTTGPDRPWQQMNDALFLAKFFPQMEARLRQAGIKPPRDIEHSLRWKGNTSTYAAEARELVKEVILTGRTR